MSGVRSSSTLRRLTIASVKPALLAIDVAAEPGPRPARIAWLVAECVGPLQRGHGFVEPAFGVVHAGQIQRPVPAVELFDLRECLGRLPQLGLAL